MENFMTDVDQEAEKVIEEAANEFQETAKEFSDPVVDMKLALENSEREISVLKQERDQFLKTSEIKLELMRNGGNYSLLSPHLENITAVYEIDGQCAVCVVGNDDQPERGPDGKLLTIADKIEEMKHSSDLSVAFNSNSKKGSGVKTTTYKSPNKSLNLFDQTSLNSNIEEIARGTVEVSA